MAQFQIPTQRSTGCPDSEDTNALRLENAELRATAADLLLETMILREALDSAEGRTGRAARSMR